ncbi:MAG: aminotransferase class I/II-fold pyridoxal phosphate-dependent enzyme [Ruminococcus sp.]|jgi:arginine/lysine/ornithine decarboxylase|nr:aminotransferase class I/II-fold pyridoxal phosphate-dependent enzyme [Ruminococcus sp.]
MTTPIVDFITRFTERKAHRLHMPGHKGQIIADFPLSDIYKYDITEIKGADFLLSAKGIIKESQENASKIFGSKKTIFTTEGSTLAAKTMISLQGSEKIIADKNAHRSFSDACTLLNKKVIWIPDTKPETVEKALKENPNANIYITSPDYFGNIADIKTIADITHSHGRILMVDNAHGSYLKFIDGFYHPIDAGADLVCDSAHKTLPVLTGGAYLHINNELFTESYKEIIKVFSSTSPSYLTLMSLDYANKFLSEPANIARMNEVAKKIFQIKNKYNITTDEPYKIAIKTLESAAKLCEDENIEPEYVSDTVLLFMFSGLSSDEDITSADRVLSKTKFAGELQEKDKKDMQRELLYETDLCDSQS